MDLSIIIPAYNEEKRIHSTLMRTLNCLRGNFLGNFEIIVVNDGSTDSTGCIVNDIIRDNPNQFRLVSISVNGGRGAAVRAGIRTATGNFVLETDADGSVDELAIIVFYNLLRENDDVDVLIGSRNARGAQILTRQSLLRVFLGNLFIILARIAFGFSSTDYALGFKMFRRMAALDIIAYQFDNHFLAEAEILFVAKKRNWRIKEMPVLWTDFRNSKVYPFRESIRSLLGLGKIILRHRRGLYSGPQKYEF